MVYVWEDSLKKPTAKQKADWMSKLATEVEYYRFIPFLFYRQWTALKQYANDKGIKVVGDIPIFVAWESVDVWLSLIHITEPTRQLAFA